MIEVRSLVRPAVSQDQRQITNLMFFESHVHRHLDWRAPLDWLGSPYYWVLEENERIKAVLASPQDPQGVAWVRLFSHVKQLSLDFAWDMLWEKAQHDLASQGGATVALIAMHQWMSDLLRRKEFIHTQDILMLERKGDEPSVDLLVNGVNLRMMQPEDLPAVAELDAEAFTPLWQNTLIALEKALPQATSATVAIDDHGLVGYQISTANPFGCHLARLAVRPDAHRRGIGSLLVSHLLHDSKNKGFARLTVNTQSDNKGSLALYHKMGFIVTGEKFPVFSYSVPPFG